MAHHPTPQDPVAAADTSQKKVRRMRAVADAQLRGHLFQASTTRAYTHCHWREESAVLEIL